MDTAIIHYAEIGIKGNNRGYFENLLIDNIKAKLGALAVSIIRETGQITVKLSENGDIDAVKDILSRIPGIAYFSIARMVELDKDKIIDAALSFLKDMKFDTFKIESVRHDKKFNIKSQELNCLVADAVINKYGKKAKMEGPDMLLKIETTSRYAYISSEQISGVGGIPVKRSQKVVVLLSGGFDSPVAAYLMMKRGCEVILVHFQNRNQMTASVQDKIEKLAEQLSKYQIKTKLYIVPFDEMQKQIIACVNSALRMLVYRKFMIDMASQIAKQEKARFLVLGDSLSQVASQTIENLEATYYGSEKPILSPLIGMDKTEITAIARKIGTFDISALPYGDCCSYFVPKHPELKATSGLLDKAEDGIESGQMITEALKNSKILEY
jgi:thiamine biosynthesis protein ThiI